MNAPEEIKIEQPCIAGLKAATADLGDTIDKDPSEGFFISNRGIITINEPRWVGLIAATGDWIFDPLQDCFFQFCGGLWSRKSRPETREEINKTIRKEASLSVEELDKVLILKTLDALVSRLSGSGGVVRRDAFSNPPHGTILVANGRIVIGRDGEIDFEEGALGRREDLQQTRLAINYDCKAKAEKTREWLNRIFSGREADVQAVAKMMGAALYGSSRWKKVVLIHGKANMGKSQIPLMVERLIGRNRVAEFETKRLGEKFEARRFVGKVFLRAEDVEADFMTRTYAETLKQLTGFGALRVEGKNSHEEFELRGDKIICATSNFSLRVRADVDRSAWEERLVYLKADGESYEQADQNSYFLDDLFGDTEEASGILNLALVALAEMLEVGFWERSEEQIARLKAVLDNGSHVLDFVRAMVKPGDNDERPGVTLGEAWAQYLRWTQKAKIEAWPERIGREMLVEAVQQTYGKSTSNSIDRGSSMQRGWRGVQLEALK